METYLNAGLGKPTDLGLGGERTGSLNAERKRWADIERANVAYGYGINATPLQIARALCYVRQFRDLSSAFRYQSGSAGYWQSCFL